MYYILCVSVTPDFFLIILYFYSSNALTNSTWVIYCFSPDTDFMQIPTERATPSAS